MRLGGQRRLRLLLLRLMRRRWYAAEECISCAKTQKQNGNYCIRVCVCLALPALLLPVIERGLAGIRALLLLPLTLPPVPPLLLLLVLLPLTVDDIVMIQMRMASPAAINDHWKCTHNKQRVVNIRGHGTNNNKTQHNTIESLRSCAVIFDGTGPRQEYRRPR